MDEQERARELERRDKRAWAFPARPVLCMRATPEPGWIDYNNHMNVGYYLIAADQAVDIFFQDWIDIGPRMAEREGMGSFVLQSHMHFLREIRAGAFFDAWIQLLDHDPKRWHYIVTLTHAETGDKAATIEQLAMCVDHATRRSAPLPEPHYRRMTALRAAHQDLAKPPEVGAALAIRRRPGA